MNKIACPELCADCPLAEVIPSEPRQLEQSNQTIALGNINQQRNKVSFDFQDGRPVGPHLVEVGLVPEGGGNGVGFWVDSSLGLEGVAQAFKECEGPQSKRWGFLKLGKYIVCAAVESFAEEA